MPPFFVYDRLIECSNSEYVCIPNHQQVRFIQRGFSSCEEARKEARKQAIQDYVADLEFPAGLVDPETKTCIYANACAIAQVLTSQFASLGDGTGTHEFWRDLFAQGYNRAKVLLLHYETGEPIELTIESKVIEELDLAAIIFARSFL